MFDIEQEFKTLHRKLVIIVMKKFSCSVKANISIAYAHRRIEHANNKCNITY